MAKYLFDTTVLIDLSKRRHAILAGVRTLNQPGNERGLCAITVTEFFTGLSPAERSHWSESIETLSYWDITREEALHAADHRYTFARRGRTLNTADVLIAAVAWEQNATLVTANVRHFPMSDIRVLSLSS